MDEDNYDNVFIKVKIISIGKDFLKDFVCAYSKFELCLVNERITDEEIEKLGSDCDWLFVVADEKNLALARKIEKSAKCFLVTNLFLFPTAEDIKISELEKDFGTVIVLPEDKISELNLERNELLIKIISSMILTMGNNILCRAMDFADVIDVMKNSGIMYASIGEGIAGSKPLDIVKKSLKNSLMKCDTSKSTKTFISFVGSEEFSMIKLDEAMCFIFDDYFKDSNTDIYWQVAIDENIDGIRVLILTN